MADTHAAEGPTRAPNRFLAMPSTKLGRWAVWLGAGAVAMLALNTFVFMPTSSSDAPWRGVVLPFFGVAMALCAVGAGVVALVAIVRQRERSWLVWLPLLPAAMMTFLLVGEVVGALLGYTH